MTDLLEHPDPALAADAATVENLLRCWLRETDTPIDEDLAIALPPTGVRLSARLRHRSAVGWHRFADVRVGDAPADAATVAALLARAAAHVRGAPPYAGADLVSRALDSAHRVTAHLAERRAHPEAPATPFLAGEQALLLGHPLHPTPKSRDPLTDAEANRYSPELRGSFPLHWFAADDSVVASDSAYVRSARDLIGPLAGNLAAPPDAVLIPAHPWQARELSQRPAIARLLANRRLRDLGPAGPAWYPTSSVRTVYRPDAAVMLKLSLGVRITNSRRENLRKELHRGAEIARLLDAGLGAELGAAHPGFGIVRDPAWLALDPVGDEESHGLDVVVRENPFTAGDPLDVTCVAGLVAEQPGIGPSRLGRLITDLARQTGTRTDDVAADWLGRYLDAIITPVLWLYSTYGLALEAHQQNTLVILDDSGWPVGGRYRDNQGYYYAAKRLGELERFLPGIGARSDSTVPDDVVDERLGYYLGINNLFGLIGAFGSLGLADERRLLDVTRQRLKALTDRLDPVPETLRTLLESPTLRGKANLLTRLHSMDELVGPVSTQSVYVPIRNPLVAS